MNRNKKLLVLVDDSVASDRAVRYVGETLAGCRGFSVLLLHFLGPLATRLRESRGAETPQGEEKLEQALVDRQNEQTRKLAVEAGALLNSAKAALGAAGIPAEAIERDCPLLFNGEDVVADVLREARQRGCATVVVGRESFSRLKELFIGHVADDLLRGGQGLAFWVVE